MSSTFQQDAIHHSRFVPNELGALVIWHADSKVWAEMAVRLYDDTRPDGDVAVSKNNVATYCIGIAFELELKALAKVAGTKVMRTHRVKRVFSSLPKALREVISEYIETELRCSADKFFTYVDRFVCHPDRKYGMIAAEGTSRPLIFEGVPIHEINKICGKLAELFDGELKKHPAFQAAS